MFLWSWRNVAHLETHEVRPVETVEVVARAKPPYPEELGDEKWGVRGTTTTGRFLQVIFVYVTIEEVEPDEYERLRLDERVELEAGKEGIRVIHARDFTDREKRRLRRRGR
jgi:uncharacterized DUF497 family protein